MESPKPPNAATKTRCATILSTTTTTITASSADPSFLSSFSSSSSSSSYPPSWPCARQVTPATGASASPITAAQATVSTRTTETTARLSLSLRTVSISAVQSQLRRTHVRHRLALMLAVPWRSASFWSVASVSLGLGAGVICVARLAFPRLRVYAIFLRQGLARLLLDAPTTPDLRASCALLIAQTTTPTTVTTTGAETTTATTKARSGFSTPVRPRIPGTPGIRPLARATSYHSFHSYRSSPAPVKPALADVAFPRDVDDEDDAPLFFFSLPRLGQAMPPASPESRSSPSPPKRPAALLQPITIGKILDCAGPSSPIRALPLERLGDSPSRNPPQEMILDSAVSSPSRVLPNKRFSLNFPIQPPSGRLTRPPSWHASPILSPEILASPTEGNFLTVLAAQERRVLELKEDLRRAEEELIRLKQHWSAHEMYKKRQQSRRVVPLQPLRTNFSLIDADDGEFDEANQLLQRETDRRKSLLSGQRVSRGKVFSGSRHTRTLSLLSPERGTRPDDFYTDSPRKQFSQALPPRTPLERSTTAPGGRAVPPFTPMTRDDIFAVVPKDALLRTGKQMVGDFREGLKTFFEDIRQATVGEEATGPSHATSAPASAAPTAPAIGTPVTSRPPTRSPPLQKRQLKPAPAKHDKKLARHSTALITSQPRAGLPSRMAYESPESAAAFWREHGVTEPPRLFGKGSKAATALKGIAATPARQKHVAATLASLHGSPAPEGDEDSWDLWDSPMRSPLPVLTPAVRSQQRRQRESSSPSVGSVTSSSHNSVGDGSELSSGIRSTLPSTTPGSPASVTATLPAPDAAATSGVGLDGNRRDSGAWHALRRMSGERMRAGILADWERGLGIAGGSSGESGV